MRIAFSCPYCGKKLAASETSVGREKTCPNCRARVVVPTPEEAAEQDAKGPPQPRAASDHPLLLMGRRPEHKDLIDMTAMVDIVFFLLIFFLVTSMQSIEAVINLPSPQSQASTQVAPAIANDSALVNVTIDNDNAVFVEEEESLSEQDLRSKLRTARNEQDKTGLMINVAASATHGKFVMVLDAAADAGLTDIKFLVQQEDEAPAGG